MAKIRLILFHLFFLSFLPASLFADTVTEEWVARYNGPENRDDSAYAMAVDNSGNVNVYVTGESVSSGTSSDYATIKYDTNGNELWTARYNGPENSSDSAPQESQRIGTTA